MTTDASVDAIRNSFPFHIIVIYTQELDYASIKNKIDVKFKANDVVLLSTLGGGINSLLGLTMNNTLHSNHQDTFCLSNQSWLHVTYHLSIQTCLRPHTLQNLCIDKKHHFACSRTPLTWTVHSNRKFLKYLMTTNIRDLNGPNIRYVNVTIA